MKVKCICNTPIENDHNYPDLTIGNIYEVYEYGSMHRLIGNGGEPCLYNSRRFEIVDGAIDEDWEKTEENGNLYYSISEEKLPDFSFEDYFNHVPEVVAQFNRYIREKFVRDVGDLEGIITHPNIKATVRRKKSNH